MNKNAQKILVIVVFFWFAQYVYIPYQTPFLTSIQVSSSFIGIIIGTYGISQMLLRLPVGLLADLKNRHKTLIIIGALTSGCASIFRFLFYNSYGFLIGNLFSGLASAMWISFMILYLSYFENQQSATARLTMCNNLGMLLGFITSTLTYDIVGMRITCLFSVISGCIAAFIATTLESVPVEEKKITIKELLKVCLRPNLIVFSLFAIIQQGVQMSTTMSYTTQIIKDMGASSFMVGLSTIIYMFAAVLCAKLASTKYCTNLGPRVFVPTVFFTTGLYCLLVPQCSSVYTIYLLQLLPGLSTGFLYSYLTSEAMKGVPVEKKSTAMGFFQAVYALGMTFIPMICGSITATSSISTSYYFLMALCFLSSILAFFYYRKYA